MHTYTFDVKMYAVVQIEATSRADAEAVLAKFVADPFATATAHSSQAGFIKAVNLYEDDSHYPYLTIYDGIELEPEYPIWNELRAAAAL